MLNINHAYIQSSIITCLDKYIDQLGEEQLLHTIIKDGYLLLSVAFKTQDEKPSISFSLTEGFGWLVMLDVTHESTMEELANTLIRAVTKLIDSNYIYFVRTNGSLSAPYTADWGYQYIKYYVGDNDLSKHLPPNLSELISDLGYGHKLNEHMLSNPSYMPKKVLMAASAYLKPDELNQLIESLDLPIHSK